MPLRDRVLPCGKSAIGASIRAAPRLRQREASTPASAAVCTDGSEDARRSAGSNVRPQAVPRYLRKEGGARQRSEGSGVLSA
jgi:hypothetical protein